jgi:hypothetical protein
MSGAASLGALLGWSFTCPITGNGGVVEADVGGDVVADVLDVGVVAVVEELAVPLGVSDPPSGSN